MPTRQFDCSICANAGRSIKQWFGMSKGAFELTEHEWFAQCLGCGALGIKIVENA